MTTSDVKSKSRRVSRDMSPEAIAKRLDTLDELYELAAALRRARPVSDPPHGESDDD